MDNIRQTSLLDRLEFEFSGTVAPKAIAFGDLDNDGCNEFVIGSTTGDLTVFKGRENSDTFHHLGFITCLAIGDAFNEGRNVLVVITGEGWLYIYETIESDEQAQEASEEVIDRVHALVAAGEEDEVIVTQHLVQNGSHRIPPNVKDIILGDIDGDGKIEVVLALTDRVVRSYKFVPSNKPRDPKAPTLTQSIHDFVPLSKWECAKQIGNMSLHHSWDGRSSLLIAQPGGTFMRIQCHLDSSAMNKLEQMDRSGSPPQENFHKSTVDYERLGLSRMRNPEISTEILGDLRTGPRDMEDAQESARRAGTVRGEDGVLRKADGTKARPYAVATLDGTIMLVQDEVILWSLAVDHQIFALLKLDVTNDGVDEIVACAWDGSTYFLDQKKNIVKYQFGSPVQTVATGMYSINNDEPSVQCLVYVTFKKKVYLYYNVRVKMSVEERVFDLTDLAPQYVNENRTLEQAKEMIRNWDQNTRADMVKKLLYGDDEADDALL